MAFVEHDGARLYWRALGKGEPLLLIMGLGCSSDMWFRLAARLAKYYRVILVDNRGSGRTEVRYHVVHGVRTMAHDVAAVLDAARESSAHLVGFSMGGMIAQQFALDHPQRVRSLVLLATNCGYPYAELAESAVLDLLFRKGGLEPEEALAAMQPYTYAETTPHTRIEEDNAVRLANYPTARGYQAQLNGLTTWTSWPWLNRVACATLILHGGQDRLIPPRNGELLASRIANAKWVEIAQASHWIITDQTQATYSAIKVFLREQRG